MQGPACTCRDMPVALCRKHLARRAAVATWHAPRAVQILLLLAAVLAVVVAVVRRRPAPTRTSKNAVL